MAEDSKFVNFTTPKWTGKDDTEASLARRFSGKDGRIFMEVTLPPHTEVTLPTGEKVDASFYKFVVPESHVREFGNDPSNYNIGIPVANEQGEPWKIRLTKDKGAYEHPEATGEERGSWIKTGTDEITVEATSFAQDMQDMRDQRKEWAQSQEKQTEKPKAKGATLKEEGAQARAAAEQLAKEAKSTPAKDKAAPAK